MMIWRLLQKIYMLQSNIFKIFMEASLMERLPMIFLMSVYTITIWISLDPNIMPAGLPQTFFLWGERDSPGMRRLCGIGACRVRHQACGWHSPSAQCSLPGGHRAPGLPERDRAGQGVASVHAQAVKKHRGRFFGRHGPKSRNLHCCPQFDERAACGNF